MIIPAITYLVFTFLIAVTFKTAATHGWNDRNQAIAFISRWVCVLLAVLWLMVNWWLLNAYRMHEIQIKVSAMLGGGG